MGFIPRYVAIVERRSLSKCRPTTSPILRVLSPSHMVTGYYRRVRYRLRARKSASNREADEKQCSKIKAKCQSTIWLRCHLGLGRIKGDFGQIRSKQCSADLLKGLWRILLWGQYEYAIQKCVVHQPYASVKMNHRIFEMYTLNQIL